MKNRARAYFEKKFFSDVKAGIITAVVALPLAMAFAIASGVPPIMGLYTAIIAGLLGSAFGGSKYSITGPTGAMTVIILSTVNKFGIEGLLLAGFMAGLIQVLFAFGGFGRFVKYIPFPIVSGFTAGIGVIIFVGQIPNFLGLAIKPRESIMETLQEITSHLGFVNSSAVMITLGSLAILYLLPNFLAKNKVTKNIPASLIALLASTIAVAFFIPVVPQVGNITSGLPSFSLINFNFELAKNVLPSAFTIALLGSIEALLCAVVCDGMTNSKHDSNKELKGQGIANLVLPFFGAIPSTAAIARSAVNIREGAKTKMAGIYHATIILFIVLFFGPYAKFIPKAFLAGILMFVSVKMVNLDEFKTIARISRADTLVLGATFLLTVLTDLVFAVQAGMFLAIFLLFVNLSKIIDVSHMGEYDKKNGINKRIYSNEKLRESVGVYTIHGPFFFGAMNVFDRKINEHMHIKKPHIIIRMKYVPFIDSTGIIRLNEFLEERKRENNAVYLTGVPPKTREKLFKDKEFRHLIPQDHIFESTQEAIEYIEKKIQS